jgi:hypothetical protein
MSRSGRGEDVSRRSIVMSTSEDPNLFFGHLIYQTVLVVDSFLTNRRQAHV